MNRGKGCLDLIVGVLRQQVESTIIAFITRVRARVASRCSAVDVPTAGRSLAAVDWASSQHLADRKMSSHRCHLIRDTRFAYHLLVWWVPQTCSCVAGVPASSGSVRAAPPAHGELSRCRRVRRFRDNNSRWKAGVRDDASGFGPAPQGNRSPTTPMLTLVRNSEHAYSIKNSAPCKSRR